MPALPARPPIAARANESTPPATAALAALSPLAHPVCLSLPRRLSWVASWHEHIPFAMFLVDLVRPRVLVELGTHYGDSYCAFCQAVAELELPATCYAVDTWTGDEHAGFYGPEVLADLRAHHDPLYGGFSRLVQSTFDEALVHFGDGTIDLLHIDGYHTYEAVRHDFETWLPKLSERAVVLLHDVNVREKGFGAWKFWEEMRQRHPSFTFAHGHGLGVLGVGSDLPDGVRPLFAISPDQAEPFCALFFELGHRITAILQRGQLATRVETLEADLRQRTETLDATARQLAELTQHDQRVAAHVARIEEELATAHGAIVAERAERARLAGELEAEGVRRRSEVAHERSLVATRDEELATIRSSVVYRVAAEYWRAKDVLLPRGTRIRRGFDRLAGTLKSRRA